MARSVISGSRNSISRDARKAFQIEGLQEVQEKCAEVLNAVSGREMKVVYYEGGKILRDDARQRAPYDPNRKKGTHLRDAIFVSWGAENKPNALVGVRYKSPGAPHAHLIEYGTETRKAIPYMRPAVAASGKQIADHIKTGLNEVIRKHTK